MRRVEREMLFLEVRETQKSRLNLLKRANTLEALLVENTCTSLPLLTLRMNLHVCVCVFLHLKISNLASCGCAGGLTSTVLISSAPPDTHLALK